MPVDWLNGLYDALGAAFGAAAPQVTTGGGGAGIWRATVARRTDFGNIAYPNGTGPGLKFGILGLGEMTTDLSSAGAASFDPTPTFTLAYPNPEDERLLLTDLAAMQRYFNTVVEFGSGFNYGRLGRMRLRPPDAEPWNEKAIAEGSQVILGSLVLHVIAQSE